MGLPGVSLSQVAGVIGELRTVEQRVAYLLERYPTTRADDRLLIVMYYKEFHGSKYLVDFLDPDLPQTTTIRRARQSLQMAGRFLQPQETSKGRARRRDIYQLYYGR